MKATKFLALAAAAVMVTSCSNDDKDFTYNTMAGVTVEMGETTVEVKENVGLFTLPLNVTGDRNGYVTVTVECVESGNDPAIANKHYYLTSDRINIPADSDKGEVEFRAVNGRGLNPDLTYTVKIVKVEGGSIGAPNATEVTIVDKGSSPAFADLAGTYIYTGTTYDFATGDMVDCIYETQLILGTPDGKGGGSLTLKGVDMFNMNLYYNYDPEEKYGELQFLYGGEAISALGSQYSFIGWTTTAGALDANPVNGTWNSSFSAATFGVAGTEYGVGFFEGDPKKFIGVGYIFGPFTIMRLPDAQ